MGLENVSSPLPSPEGTRKVLFPSRHKYTSSCGLFFMLGCTPLTHQSTRHLQGRRLGVWRCPSALRLLGTLLLGSQGAWLQSCLSPAGGSLPAPLPACTAACSPQNHSPAPLETSAALAAGSWQHWQGKIYHAGVLDGKAQEK